MKETLNQDAEPHESCQLQSWRRGMGPTGAAYERPTDSGLCWHKKRCEEVVKISAGLCHEAWKPVLVKKRKKGKPQIFSAHHSSLLTTELDEESVFLCSKVRWIHVITRSSHLNSGGVKLDSSWGLFSPSLLKSFLVSNEMLCWMMLEAQWNYSYKTSKCLFYETRVTFLLLFGAELLISFQ